MTHLSGMQGWRAGGCLGRIDWTGEVKVSTLYIRERFDGTDLTVSGDVVENLWMRFRGMEDKEDDVVSV